MKRSLVRLFVAVITLAAALVELAVRVVQFTIGLVDCAARRVEGKMRRPAVVAVAAAAPVTAPQAPPDAEERLVGALTGPSAKGGLGFRVGPARAFAATVRTRLATEPMQDLVRDGILHLTSN
jgi:hypothetical protein